MKMGVWGLLNGREKDTGMEEEGCQSHFNSTQNGAQEASVFLPMVGGHCLWKSDFFFSSRTSCPWA